MVLDISSTVTLNNGVKMPLFGLGLYQTKLGQETQNSVKWAFESNYRHLNRIIGILIQHKSIEMRKIWVLLLKS